MESEKLRPVQADNEFMRVLGNTPFAIVVRAVECHENLVEALEQCQQEFVLSLRNTMLGNRIQNLLAIAKGKSQ